MARCLFWVEWLRGACLHKKDSSVVDLSNIAVETDFALCLAVVER